MVRNVLQFHRSERTSCSVSISPTVRKKKRRRLPTKGSLNPKPNKQILFSFDAFKAVSLIKLRCLLRGLIHLPKDGCETI